MRGEDLLLLADIAGFPHLLSRVVYAGGKFYDCCNLLLYMPQLPHVTITVLLLCCETSIRDNSQLKRITRRERIV